MNDRWKGEDLAAWTEFARIGANIVRDEFNRGSFSAASPEWWADRAGKYADAMMAEREKRKPPNAENRSRSGEPRRRLRNGPKPRARVAKGHQRASQDQSREPQEPTDAEVYKLATGEDRSHQHPPNDTPPSERSSLLLSTTATLSHPICCACRDAARARATPGAKKSAPPRRDKGNLPHLCC